MTFTINQPIKQVNGPRKDAYDEDESMRTELHGPPPVNPFTTLRTNRGLNFNQLSIFTRVDSKALTRLEKGMYVNPLPRVVDYWVNLGLITEGEVCSEYEDFRYQNRRRNEFYLGTSLYFDTNLVLHPLRQLRLHRPSLVDKNPLPVGLFDFCAALCLPLDSIQHFEKKWRTVQSVPKELKLALNQIGYTREQISTFERTYLEWRSHHTPKVSVS